MKKISSKKARIVTDRYLGYEVQVWRWWFPFWIQPGLLTNTHSSMKDAEDYARTYLSTGNARFVKEVTL